eukprot:9020094-Pyramimonas_sp.AAC.1
MPMPETPDAKPFDVKVEATCLGSSPGGDATGPRVDATGPRGDATGPRVDATGPRGDATGPRVDATGPRGDATGPTGEATPESVETFLRRITPPLHHVEEYIEIFTKQVRYNLLRYEIPEMKRFVDPSLKRDAVGSAVSLRCAMLT